MTGARDWLSPPATHDDMAFNATRWGCASLRVMREGE